MTRCNDKVRKIIIEAIEDELVVLESRRNMALKLGSSSHADNMAVEIKHLRDTLEEYA